MKVFGAITGILFIMCGVFAQEEEEPLPPPPLVQAPPVQARGGDFWVGPSADSAFYGVTGPAFGGGFEAGYGTGASIGIKAAFYAGAEGLNSLEILFLFRRYFDGRESCSGPFIQFGAGPVFFAEKGEPPALPAENATISAGACFGWRFLFGRYWFAEPSLRFGYPFLAGLGVAAGFHY